MKKLTLLLIAALASIGLFVAPVMAQDPCASASESTYCTAKNSATENPLFGKGGAGTKITQLLVVISGLVSVVFVIIGGIGYITSGGDSKKTASAKNTILYACIGVVVTLLAQSLVTFILNKL